VGRHHGFGARGDPRLERRQLDVFERLERILDDRKSKV